MIDNPADRLLTLLNKGKEKSGSDNCGEVWAELLKVPDNNDALLISRLGKVMGLTNEIRNEIINFYPDMASAQDYWIEKVNFGFRTQQLVGSWSTFQQHFDEHTYTGVKNAAYVLSGGRSVNDENALDELNSLKNELIDLKNEIIDSSSIDPGIKIHIVRGLQSIIESIDEYFISGIGSLVDNVGKMAVYVHYDKSLGGWFNNTELGKKTNDIFVKVLRIVSAAADVAQLTPIVVEVMKKLSG